MYRIHVYDKTTTGMHWHIHKGGARHYDKHVAAETRMPAAIAVGGDPSVIYAASAPLPEKRGRDASLQAFSGTSRSIL